ncbi:plasmid pRiA4b ORF-3 family protein [Actinoplanes sp. TRM 88003]|uniref:Plasmid pRiA4b ORF-3 family protein n=1 Tax=Paractinoplanes aksuensis TaxID=2939490 RepID=A0ABT1DRY8_9ACTN|nr:plasmid pRiA4b ORF-3 family protein [Actinoplanes aksuensis]MCO8273585.1 plasmid pRiA4b ORF-3 family protein [Actinoplanes aksuensis]
MLTELIDGAATTLAEAEDPLDAELAGALFGALARSVDDLLPTIEAHGSAGALALLGAIGAVGDNEQAWAAARRLADRGIAEPAWLGDLRKPLTAGPFTRMYDTEDTMSVLIGVFERAGRGHALVIAVDHENCGEADQIFLLDEEELPTLVAGMHRTARADRVTIKTQKLGAPEFRWYAEQALEIRADHGEDDEPDDDEGPGYLPLAVLTRSRLAGLAPARQPRGAVASTHADDPTPLDVMQQFAAVIGRSAPRPPKLPAKRKKSNGPAPAYQIKVSLSGAKPPIWRRLQVRGDITLDRLHHVLLTAFGWDGSHLHVFDTAYGQFGRADRELGYRSDGPVTLEQVAREEKSKLCYTYDFGDNWEHEILIEKVTPADPTADYPLCTAGRRAAPPDDCGGIWGYQELIEILADPTHEEHRDRLEWLGLTDASQFNPATFNPDQVNQHLRSPR